MDPGKRSPEMAHRALSDGDARFRAERGRLARDPTSPLPEEVDMLRALASTEAPYPVVLRARDTLQPD